MIKSGKNNDLFLEIQKLKPHILIEEFQKTKIDILKQIMQLINLL